MYELLNSLRVVEDPHLPRNTMRAPLSLIREIQCTIGGSGIRLEVSADDDVHFSNDLFVTFAWWQDRIEHDSPAQSGDWN
jgi:hypothetical protein